MIKPRPLKAGDSVAITATARRIHPDDIQQAIHTLESWGLRVVLSPYLFSETHGYLAGTDEQRLAAIQTFLDDPSIAAILCARGGYGTTRILDSLDFKQFKLQPKWVVGFSDITALHLRISELGIQSIHGTMPLLFSKSDSKESIESLKAALFHEPDDIITPPDPNNRHGVGTGVLTGGNLSLVADSLGTSYEVETAGKILVLEEVDEYLYRIDRMFVQLKRSRKLESLAGLVIGHFTEIKDGEVAFGETVEEIVRYHTQDFQYPIAFRFPSGHINPNLSWRCGAKAMLEVNATGAKLKHQR